MQPVTTVFFHKYLQQILTLLRKWHNMKRVYKMMSFRYIILSLLLPEDISASNAQKGGPEGVRCKYQAAGVDRPPNPQTQISTLSVCCKPVQPLLLLLVTDFFFGHEVRLDFVDAESR